MVFKNCKLGRVSTGLPTNIHVLRVSILLCVSRHFKHGCIYFIRHSKFLKAETFSFLYVFLEMTLLESNAKREEKKGESVVHSHVLCRSVKSNLPNFTVWRIPGPKYPYQGAWQLGISASNCAANLWRMFEDKD